MMTKKKPAQVFPPGDFLSEELEARGWSQSDFAEIIDRPIPLVSHLINGKTAITPETALGISEALGTTAEFWLNLESAYQLSKVGPRQDVVARRAKLYALAPVRELVRRNWIEGSGDIDVMEQQVSRFLALAEGFAHAARKSTPYDSANPSQRAWLCRARQLAPSAPVHKVFAPASLPKLIGELRTLMVNPEDVRRVPRLLADYGIRVLVIEPLTGAKIDGATFWLGAKSPVIALSLRFDRIDYFWYTLIHELAHVKNKDALTLDVNLNASDTNPRPKAEQEADEFAAATVVPRHEIEDFISRVGPVYSTVRIQGFAKRIGVHPGVVVGQLHHRGEIGYRILRQLLVPVRHIVTRVALTDGWRTQLRASS